MVLAHCGWSVQLYLESNRLEPFDLEALGSNLIASFSVPARLLSIGTAWTLVWRDDRAALTPESSLGRETPLDAAADPRETVVGLVNEIEGGARETQASLVGTSLSPSRDENALPNVKGIIRMGISPLKLQLILKQGQDVPVSVHAHPLPLATFDLVVYPDEHDRTASFDSHCDDHREGTVNSGASNPATSSSLASRPAPAGSIEVTAAATNIPAQQEGDQRMSQTVQERQASKIALLDRQLYVANDRAEFYEHEVATIYGFLPLAQRFAYLSHRLVEKGDKRGRTLSPELRIALAELREQARNEIEAEARDAVKREVERMVISLIQDSGDTKRE
ncbi:hypothetical protein JCM3766R1_002667 [Sporobolomyces carnicolor]